MSIFLQAVSPPILSRLIIWRPFGKYRSSQMLVIVNSTLGDRVFEPPSRISVEGFHRPPNAPKRSSKPFKIIWRLLQLLGSLQKLSNVGNS